MKVSDKMMMVIKVADVKLFVLFNRYFGTSFNEFKELTDEDKCFLNECVDDVIKDEEDLIDEEYELVLSEDDREFLKGIVKPVNINVGGVKINDEDIKILRKIAQKEILNKITTIIANINVSENFDVVNIADRIKELLAEQIALSGKGVI